jgi:hypothetical protein
MFIIYLIIIIFSLFFTKELVAANEERIIVTSLVLVLSLGLHFLSKIISNELNNNSLNIFNELKSYMIVYYSIIKAFEKLCISRNMFFNAFFKSLLLTINYLHLILLNWLNFSKLYIYIILYNLLNTKLIFNIVNKN